VRFVRHSIASSGRRLGTVVLALGLAVATSTALGGSASAATVCDPADPTVCVTVPDTADTPLGAVTATVDPATGVVTVHLEPTSANTLVFGVPFAIPPGPPIRPAYARTTVDTAGGLVVIDTFKPPSPNRLGFPNIAIISIKPPGPPTRVSTFGTTVVFTPIRPPGPPV